MSAGNVIAINGSYTIRKIDSDGETIIPIESHNSSLDILSVNYQGYSYMVHVDDNPAINGSFNSFSIVDQVSSDLSSFNMILRLRTEIDNNKALLIADAPIQPENIFENIIDVGQVTFTYDGSLILEDSDGDGQYENLGCTNPLASNYDSCALFDMGTCEYPTYLGSDDFAEKGCNDYLACTCDNPICDCEYCDTQHEFVCNMSKDQSTTIIVDDEEITVSGKGFRNVMSDGTTNKTTNCQYPIYPVDVGFIKKYFNWADLESNLNPNMAWIFQQGQTDNDVGYYDNENNKTSKVVPTMGIEIRCNSSNIKKFSFKINKIQLYESFETSGFENDFLSLFDSFEINNNNDTTPSIVTVDAILSNTLVSGQSIILNLPIENLITLNVNLSDIVFFNESNEIIEYNLNSDKIQNYIDSNWDYMIYSNTFVHSRRVCNEASNTENLFWPSPTLDPSGEGVEFNQENVWEYYCNLSQQTIEANFIKDSFFAKLGGKSQLQKIELHRGLNRISPIITPGGTAYHYQTDLGDTSNPPKIINVGDEYYGWEINLNSDSFDRRRYDAIVSSRKYPWVRKIYTYGFLQSGDQVALDNSCGGGPCYENGDDNWMGGEGENDLAYSRWIASASYNVDICTNYVDESGTPDINAYYCFKGNKCVLEDTGELAYYWDDEQSADSNHFSYPHACHSDADCQNSSYYASYEQAGDHAISQGYKNVFWDSQNNRPKVKCETSNAEPVGDPSSPVCQGGFWDGNPALWVSLLIPGTSPPSMPSFYWCPGSSENLFELDIFGTVVGSFNNAFPYKDDTINLPIYGPDDSIPVWYEDVSVGNVAGLNAVDVGFSCQCKDHLYETFSTIKGFSEDSIQNSYYQVVDGIIGDMIDIIEYETELITHVDTNDDNSYDTWLGTLTQLKPGRGYRLKTGRNQSGGLDPWEAYDYHVSINYDGYYDISGICTGGSSTHERNSRIDENSTFISKCSTDGTLEECWNSSDVCYGGIYNNIAKSPDTGTTWCLNGVCDGGKRDGEPCCCIGDDCDVSNCGSDDPDDADYNPTFNVETECPRELLRDGCAGNFCNEPYDVLTWYSDMDKDFNVIQQGSGRTFNLTKKLCSNLDEPYTFLVCPDDMREYYKYDPVLGYELETEMQDLINDFNSEGLFFNQFIPGHPESVDRNELICSQNCSVPCIEVNYFKQNYNDCVGVVDCNGNCFYDLQLSDDGMENYAYNYNYFSRYDKYGVCCLQGNIDQCGVCNGDNSSCSTDCPFETIFAQVVFDVVGFSQISPSDPPELPYADYTLNNATIYLQIQSPENYIQEIEFDIFSNVTNATINSEDFNITTDTTEPGSNSDVTKIIIQSFDEGAAFLPNEVINISLVLNEFYPNNISEFIEDGFNICLDYSSIKIYTLGDRLLEVTTSGETSEGKICTSQIENFDGVNYYGCSDDSSFNYDVNCETLIPYEESENTGLVYCSDIYCQFTDQDCNGVPGGSSYLDNCGICVESTGSLCDGGTSAMDNLVCTSGEGNCNWQDENSAFGCDCVCFSGAELDCAGVCQGPNLESYIPEGSSSAGQTQCCTGLLPGVDMDEDDTGNPLCPDGQYFWNGQCYNAGDVMPDGMVNVSDVVSLVNYILGTEEFCIQYPDSPLCAGV